MTKATFKWDDPFLFNDQLASEERIIRAVAHKYCMSLRGAFVATSNDTLKQKHASSNMRTTSVSRYHLNAPFPARSVTGHHQPLL